MKSRCFLYFLHMTLLAKGFDGNGSNGLVIRDVYFRTPSLRLFPLSFISGHHPEEIQQR